MRIIFIGLCLIITFSGFSQKKNKKRNKAQTQTEVVKIEPIKPDTFRYDSTQYVENVRTSIKFFSVPYTEEAKAASVEGTAILSFIFDEKCNATNPIIKQGLGYGIDEAILNAFNRWKDNPENFPSNSQCPPGEISVPFPFKLDE